MTITAPAASDAPVRVGRPGWEVLEDGTVWPVLVLSARPSMFGSWQVQRTNGDLVTVYRANLRSADNIDVKFA